MENKELMRKTILMHACIHNRRHEIEDKLQYLKETIPIPLDMKTDEEFLASVKKEIHRSLALYLIELIKDI